MNKLREKFLSLFNKREKQSNWDMFCLEEKPNQKSLPTYWERLDISEKQKWIEEFMDKNERQRYFRGIY